MKAILVIAVALVLCVSPALSGIPIPNTPDGYQIGSASAPVVFEFFGDLMCPVTAAVYPTIKQVFTHYGPDKMKFLFHAYSLPYHRNAFLSNKGTWVIAANNPANVFTYIEQVLAHQVDLFNAPSANMSTNDVLNYLAKLAQTNGLMSAQAFLTGMDDDNVDLNAIGSWKYGASRAISGTPTTIVNGAVVDADSSWSLSDWQQVLDPLFPAHRVRDCANGTVACEYAPGKVECCLAGEFCIKNEGCTCAKDLKKTACSVSHEDQETAKECDAPNVPCEYLPGKIQCCLPGEMCLLNVGCRCALDEKKKTPAPAKKPAPKQPLCRIRKGSAAFASAKSCEAPEVPCEYLPNKFECCLAGEACIHNVGCRCAVAVEVSVKKDWQAGPVVETEQPLCRYRKEGEVNSTACTTPEVPCEYLPGKIQCCLEGEACIRNVGCRCGVNDYPVVEQDDDVIFPPHDDTALCHIQRVKTMFSAPPTCPATQFPCEYLPDHWHCCFAGDFCIRNVGCQC
jgi:protein-disulfide isomerase